MEQPLPTTTTTTTAAILFLSVLTSLPHLSWMTSASDSHPTKFRAAVYEHRVVMPVIKRHFTRPEALELMQKNLDVYKQQTDIAREQGADIIVFPEDGIYGPMFTRQTIYPFLETIPDPRRVTWSPCDDPERFPDTEVQRALSCMAKDNFIYVVADMGDKQPCDVTQDPKCPPDGRYQYNTAVAFGPEGHLVARYHKVNLFFEDQFNAADPEPIYFDTTFGRFGLFICFDIIFQEPAITLYEKYNITNVAYPTAWMDAMPLLSAIGFHSSFARGLGVNVLAANLHLPFSKFHGSGIYSPKGEAAFYYNKKLFSPPKLMVADLRVLDRAKPDPHYNIGSLHILNGRRNSFKSSPDWLVEENRIETKLRKPLKYFRKESRVDNELDSLITDDAVFYSELFHDNFTFKALDKDAGFVKVCENDACCELHYSINTNVSKRGELFAFGVFDGLHTYQGKYYIQVCTLVKCADSKGPSLCGSSTFVSNTVFSQIQIRGHFGSKYVYPQVVLASPDKNLRLASQEEWAYHRGNSLLTTSPDLRDPVLFAALISRDYSRDSNASQSGTGASQDQNILGKKKEEGEEEDRKKKEETYQLEIQELEKENRELDFSSFAAEQNPKEKEYGSGKTDLTTDHHSDGLSPGYS
ncbi:pantetheinase-like [Aplysia californica]|uniref:Pantetheinase-like n=1 Tax=Aplysia californica TaxID=6500 RepID=A0ABM1W2L3_APLCA|nr:pantetheinase-like [Aplysia californica]